MHNSKTLFLAGLGVLIIGLLIFFVVSYPTFLGQPQPVTTNPCESGDDCVARVAAVVTRGCAPWDAITIDVHFPYEGKSVSMQIYPEGLDIFKAGQPVALEHGGRTPGTGSANLCDIGGGNCSTYASREATIFLPTAIVDAKSMLSGWAKLKGVTIPLEVTWDPNGRACR
jgi:hypothetical protein